MIGGSPVNPCKGNYIYSTELVCYMLFQAYNRGMESPDSNHTKEVKEQTHEEKWARRDARERAIWSAFGEIGRIALGREVVA